MAIIGGGPAGLCAAISAASSGAKVLLMDRNRHLGGQLVKQTHMFFGSEKQYASTRGIDISEILLNQLASYREKVEILGDTTVLGLYEDGVVSAIQGDQYFKLKPDVTVVATGASEKVLAFPGNDLPGIYGAGAAQTLMNVYGVKPGDRVLMVGAGNIGLIVSYQLMQAGVQVAAIIDASPRIGGYLVHASKIRRMGIPILTGHTIKEAKGENVLQKAVIWQVDERFNGVSGTEKEMDVDVICLSVGLSPLVELLQQAGCEMKYIPELSGVVPVIDENHMTTKPFIYAAGDVSGVEEASSAMVEGYLAGLCAAKTAGYKHENYDALKEDYHHQIDALRAGPQGERIRRGVAKMKGDVE